jgi:exopolysaccharide biosynthesis glucuronosyltransferase PssE
VIFLTIGTQLPFDRLVRPIDAWVGAHPDVECFAQIGTAEFEPQHMQFAKFLTADETRRRMQEAELIIAHAGMGTVISALQMGKPLLIMPRQCAFGEQRNDHQLASAAAFRRRPNIFVAMDETEIAARMDELTPVRAFHGEPIGPHASPGLLAAVREFIGTDGGRGE